MPYYGYKETDMDVLKLIDWLLALITPFIPDDHIELVTDMFADLKHEVKCLASTKQQTEEDINDLAKLSAMLLSDEEVFEKLVADAVLAGPAPRVTRMVKAAWDNDPSGIMCHEANIPKIQDYIKKCCKKHN